MRRAAAGTLAALVGGLAACGGSSAEAPPLRAARALHLVRIGTFDSPLYVTAPPGDRRRVLVVEQGGVTAKRSLPFTVRQLSSFGEDARGRVYVTSLGGAVYRLAQ